MPSTAQQTIVEELKPRNLSNHTLVVIPRNLFSLVFEKEFKVKWLLEMNLSPYSCRMVDGKLEVLGRKKRVFIAASGGEFGVDLDPGLKRELEGVFPMELCWCRNVVEVCLLNVNGVFHPLIMLMNVGS